MFDEYGNDVPAGALLLHYVQITDTLGSLAAHYYGDPSLAQMILDHNTHYIPDPNHLVMGITLAIPYHPMLRARVVKC
jgi:hypothetical protein